MKKYRVSRDIIEARGKALFEIYAKDKNDAIRKTKDNDSELIELDLWPIYGNVIAIITEEKI
jgi:hypothetical protein